MAAFRLGMPTLIGLLDLQATPAFPEHIGVVIETKTPEALTESVRRLDERGLR